ncbi:MAG: branched-chain amino acid transporter substrate-binding protein [Ramlibacter sp.]|nr:branched-chain amino acid transporter substrate-binding protein [Ramlibacter sp.]
MRLSLIALLAATALAAAAPAQAQKNYGPGVSDTEIRIGQTVAYSGPASAYAMVGRMQVGYFKMLNEVRGGINGRKITVLSTDDASAPPKTVEATRKLVEGDEVFAMMNSMGTATQTAVQKYLNGKKVPQVFIYASSPNLHDIKDYPWTIPFAFSFEIEGEIYGKYLTAKPDARIGVLYQNDDVGKSYLKGFMKGLGDKSRQVVKVISYEYSDPTVDSQVLQLQAAGADTFVSFSTNKAQAQALRKAAAIGWKPMYFLSYVSSSISGVLRPAGVENAVGVISSAWFKSPNDPEWDNDKAMLAYLAFMKKYMPNDDPGDTTAVYTYMGTQLAALALERCGNDLTRENLMKQITSFKDVELGLLLPGQRVNLSTTDSYPVRGGRLVRFDGTSWKPISELITVSR